MEALACIPESLLPNFLALFVRRVAGVLELEIH